MVQIRSIFSSSTSLFSLERCALKHDIVEKLGGEAQLHFLIIAFCERIRDDRWLKILYECLDEEGLLELQKDMVLICFMNLSASEYKNLRSKLMLRLCLIFQEGECRYPEAHFEALESNFVSAMRDCWVDEAVLGQCKGYFGALRSVLEDVSCLNQRIKMEDDAYMDSASFGIVGQVISFPVAGNTHTQI